MEKFWMVLVADAGAPNKRHETHAEAVAEAERLARMNTGRTVYLLEAIAYCQRQEAPLVWAGIDGEEGKS